MTYVRTEFIQQLTETFKDRNYDFSSTKIDGMHWPIIKINATSRKTTNAPTNANDEQLTYWQQVILFIHRMPNSYRRNNRSSRFQNYFSSTAAQNSRTFQVAYFQGPTLFSSTQFQKHNSSTFKDFSSTVWTLFKVKWSEASYSVRTSSDRQIVAVFLEIMVVESRRDVRMLNGTRKIAV